MRYLRHGRKLLLYLLLPALNFISPFLFIPAVTHRFGAQGWSALAIAISIGGAVSVAAEMGWGVVGPQKVAGLSPTQRPAYYRLSIPSRMIVVGPAALVCGVICFFVVPELNVPCAIFAAAMTCQGMTPSWYFIGIDRPMHVFWSESLPRVVVTLASALVVFLGGPLIIYSIAMLLTVPLAQLIARYLIDGYEVPTREDWQVAPKVARAQFVLGSGRAVSVVYTTLPVFIVGLVAQPAVAVFAASERLMRASVSMLQAVPLRLQSWIGSASEVDREHRIRTAQKIGLLLGIVCGTGFALLAPLVSHIVFTGKIDIPLHVSVASGILLLTICVSTSLGLSLVARGRPEDITWAIIPSALLAAISIGPLAVLFGPVGGIAGEILAELCGVWVQYRALQRGARRPAHRAKAMFDVDEYLSA